MRNVLEHKIQWSGSTVHSFTVATTSATEKPVPAAELQQQQLQLHAATA